MTGTVPPNQSFTATIIHYVRQIIEKKLNIDSIKDEIETLRCENWSNYEIAHYYVAKSEPKNSTSGFTEKLSKYMPGAGKAVLKLIKIISESKQKLDLFGQYINSITGIALSYDPSISDVKVLYSPVAKVFVNAINPDEGGKISLTDRDSVKMLEHIKVYLPQIAKKIGVESFVDFASGIAESFPFIGGVVKQGVNQKIGQNGRLIGNTNLVALIEDYENLNPTPNLETIKKFHRDNKIFDHLSAVGKPWYKNRHVLYYLTLISVFFPPTLLLLIYGLGLNQSESESWLWYTDERLVLTNLIFLPIGLYGVSKGKLFNYGPNWYDNKAYLILTQVYLLPLIVTSPVALYALWRSKALEMKWKIIISIVFCVYFGMLSFDAGTSP